MGQSLPRRGVCGGKNRFILRHERDLDIYIGRIDIPESEALEVRRLPEEAEYDEHVWLSLRNAKVLCKAIADNLAEIDTENANTYQENEKAYADKLDELDKKYQETVDSASQKTLLFGDRFPFRYMVDDYGLSYYAAFPGCAEDTEPSARTIAF